MILDDITIAEWRTAQQFCEVVCGDSGALYDCAEPDRINFLWKSQVVCQTTQAKILEAIKTEFGEDFSRQLQATIREYIERVDY